MLNEIVRHLKDNMLDVAPDTRGVNIQLLVGDNPRVLGFTQNLSNIGIYPHIIFFHSTDDNCNPQPDKFADLALHVIAHEFRHTQQELLWKSSLPRVQVTAAWRYTNTPDPATYAVDPGEADAEKFAEYIVANTPNQFKQELAQYLFDWIWENWAEFKEKNDVERNHNTTTTEAAELCAAKEESEQ